MSTVVNIQRLCARFIIFFLKKIRRKEERKEGVKEMGKWTKENQSVEES